MIELPIGSIIKSKRVNYRRRRIAALFVLGLGIAFGIARTGTTILTIREGERPRPAVTCGAMGCSGNNPTHHVGGGYGGGGTIKLGS